jgi:hypothetical protein
MGDNIKMDVREVEWGQIEWIYLDEDGTGGGLM